jgi:hypothetical protein
MRTISEATLAILKSQTMLEQNKFNCEVKLEGYDAGYSGIESSVLKSNANVSCFDFEITSNGQVLVVYKYGLGIYLLTIASLDLLLSTDNIITGGTLFYTLASSVYENCISIKRIANGQLLLFIADNGRLSTGVPQSTKCYVSVNGLGTDFTLRSTVATMARLKEAGASNYEKNFVAKPAQLSDGSLVLSAPKYASYSGYDQSQYSTYKSIDNGITWTLKGNVTHRYYTLSGSMYGDIINIRDCVFCTCRVNYLNWFGMLFFSADKGETWTMYFAAYSDFPSYSSTYKYATLGYNSFENKMYLSINEVEALREYDIYQSVEVPDVISPAWINTLGNWNKIASNVIATDVWQRLTTLQDGKIILTHKQHSADASNILGYNRTLYSAAFPASSISISKGRGSANTMTIGVDNNEAALNPLNPDSDLFGILNLNKQVIVKMGYGDDLIETFTGLIDEFTMKSYPHLMEISCRDNLKKALDQTITEGNQNTVSFTDTAIESIFGYLCYLAGIETGTIETTGISISKIFSWQSYADAFQFLADLASFEYGADEYGKLFFRRDYQPNNMAISYTFEEGIDIKSMSYKMADGDLYYRVKAYGKSGDTIIVYDAPFVDAAKYNILSQKVLKVDVAEAKTVGELRTIAERALYLMKSRTAIVDFEAIAVPWLQVGDFIQVYERSSMSTGIYRISSMTLNLTPKTFTMRITCYYYGDSIVVGELPTETATQTADPNLNLIPEMTSNTTPSGVARASSIYNGTYEPWQALNSTDADYYWNSIAATGWIEYQFTELTIVDKYMLKARQAIEYNDAMPKNWTFEAFNGEIWIILDTRTNQSAWGISETRQYLFANTQAYSKYRLNVSANNGYSRLQLEQLAMYYGGGS